jgi:hypothetical protein
MNKEHTALYDLLIESCRHTPDAQKLETYVARIDDWAGFLDSAYVHGVFPLVHKSLKSITAVPDAIKLRLKSTNLEIARRNMTMTAELLKIMKLLEENGIPALAIKGPVLSQMIHGDVTQRQYADLDILLHTDDLYRAGKLLQSHGYSSEHSIEFLKNKALLKIAKDFTISTKNQNIHIELHWQLFLDRQVKKSKIQFFSKTPNTYILGDQSVSTLEVDTLLFYLLLHGSKHLWERLEWIVDIDRIIRCYDKIDWESLSVMAKEMEIELMFYLGLAMCHDLFQTSLPEFIHTAIRANGKVPSTAKVLREKLVSDTINNVETISIAFINLDKVGLIKDGKSELLRHYWLTLFGLKDVDVYVVNLPNQLSFLYHFIRLYRMFKFYVLRVK